MKVQISPLGRDDISRRIVCLHWPILLDQDSPRASMSRLEGASGGYTLEKADILRGAHCRAI